MALSLINPPMGTFEQFQFSADCGEGTWNGKECIAGGDYRPYSHASVLCSSLA